MSVVEIVFSSISEDPQLNYSGWDEYPLFFTAYDISPARKWLKFLQSEVDKDAPVERSYLKDGKVNGRFVGFPSHQKDADDLANLINRCIDVVNSYSPGAIPIKATNRANQEDLNELHKYFEVLRGPRLAPAPLFLNGNDELRTALEDFNLLIHEFESFNISNQTQTGSFASVDVTFKKNWTRHPFSIEDYQYFDPARDFGGLYLHYCDVGKPLLDAYHNRDEVISTGNIRPLQFISADFDLFLGKPTKQNFDLAFKTKFNAWLHKLGLDPSDPKLSIGYLKVGQLIQDARIRHMEQEEFLKLMAPYLNVKRIVIHG